MTALAEATGEPASSSPPRGERIRLSHLFRPMRAEIDSAAKPSDGLVVFSVLWGLAMTLSAVSHTRLLAFDAGLVLGVLEWGILGAALALVVRPRQSWRLGLLALLMTTQYLLRLPVASNNQTIAVFMNVAILLVLGGEFIRKGLLTHDRDVAFERLRVVARALLATMYFYGIFHKINYDFLTPSVSCASALYSPLTRAFWLDTNVTGMYLAIAATFVVEAIALVCLYWRRYFWVGLLISIPFHYVIPISGYSWYMDFSSLVLALYMLSVPRDVAAGLYSTSVTLVRRTPWLSAGPSALLGLVLLLGLAALVVVGIAEFYPDRSPRLLWHSVWLIVWATVGGAAMVLLTRAALLEVPYDATPSPRQPLWLYAIPATLFVTSLSPYFGLKTESSIAMFSNLHTEGGQSNHLLFPTPPYLFDYQRNVARIIDSSDPSLQKYRDPRYGIVEFELARRLSQVPDAWVTYELNGQSFERVTNATFPGNRPNWLESKLLLFKRVDWARPKVCTH